MTAPERFQRAALAALLCLATPRAAIAAPLPHLSEDTVAATTQRLVAAHGGANADRIGRGVRQVAERWWSEDGDDEAFGRFCDAQLVTDDDALRALFDRLERVMELVDGHLHEVRREIRRPLDLDTGPLSPFDELLGSVAIEDHVDDDLYRTKVAFAALLNFPVHTLSERRRLSEQWDRETWARSRMMDRFAERVPAEVTRRITAAFSAADQYIAAYDIRMDRLADERGRRPFKDGLRLIAHWGLRDELKAQYAEPSGIERQRLIAEVMRRIVRQEIPGSVVGNPGLVWAPVSNRVWRAGADGAAEGDPIDAPREPDTRYERLLDVFHAVRKADPYSPTAPTYIDRRFLLEREIPEPEAEALLRAVLESAELRDLAQVVQQRLGRPLEPFDIWYDGFEARQTRSESELDALVRERYPDVAAFQADLPRILGDLGFSVDKAGWLARHIVVDPARGAGHAMGAVRRGDRAHLRTRFGPQGMDFKGYNIAIHELGHNVEQVFSLEEMDHWWLAGVPASAFTEAIAFVFQERDQELLGLAQPGRDALRERALGTLWNTAEIAGVALVDMGVWHFLYDHPNATAAELREATLRIARDVWNRYYAPSFGQKDVELLAIYSHIIEYGLYVPDYPLGYLIAFQVAGKLREGDFGAELERMAKLGRLLPDTWMHAAVGQPLSAQALLSEARAALDAEPSK